jgi:hypothetical protein
MLEGDFHFTSASSSCLPLIQNHADDNALPLLSLTQIFIELSASRFRRHDFWFEQRLVCTAGPMFPG